MGPTTVSTFRKIITFGRSDIDPHINLSNTSMVLIKLFVKLF